RAPVAVAGEAGVGDAREEVARSAAAVAEGQVDEQAVVGSGEEGADLLAVAGRALRALRAETDRAGDGAAAGAGLAGHVRAFAGIDDLARAAAGAAEHGAGGAAGAAGVAALAQADLAVHLLLDAVGDGV